MSPTLIQYAGDDQPGRLRGVRLAASTLFRQGKDTHEIAIRKDEHEHIVLKRVTLERCRRLGLPNPYEAGE